MYLYIYITKYISIYKYNYIMFGFLLFILRYFQKKNSESFCRSWGNLLWYFWTRILILWDMKFSHKFSCRYLQKLLSMDILVIHKTNKRLPTESLLGQSVLFSWGKNPQPSDFNLNLKKVWPTSEMLFVIQSFSYFFPNKSAWKWENVCSF